MLAKDVMNKKVITIKENDTLDEVIRKFSKKGISGAPVVKNNIPVGVISDSDVIDSLDIYGRINLTNVHDLALAISKMSTKSIDKFKAQMDTVKKLKAKDVMTDNPFTLNENETLTKVTKEMHKKDINRVIIVDSKGKLKGIITRKDIINALIEK